jgi:hypothetical protein
MAKRVGLNNSETGKAVSRPAANLSANLFGGQAVEEPKKEEVVVEETVEEEEVVEEVVKEEPKAVKTPKATKKAKAKEEEELIRQTYFLTPTQIEAIRILAFERNKKKNELVRELLDESIPKRIKEQASENLANRK